MMAFDWASFAGAQYSTWTVFSGILDILLVSWLIYRILLLVRGTRAQPMMVGLIIIGFCYVASRQLGLATLNWILGNFLGSVILVIVVLFQDDFRRALIKVGLFPGLGGQTPRQLEECIREVAKAATEMAEKRTGALIVIGRNVGLDDFTEHSVPIDAVVTHQLLESIFQTSSPIHDGAVVIERHRITAAGAVLPLTFNPTVSKSFGTRHRAAIGLSERTDAVMVVVSEETGKVSLVREGRLTKELSEKTLVSALTRLLRTSQPKLKLASDTKKKSTERKSRGDDGSARSASAKIDSKTSDDKGSPVDTKKTGSDEGSEKD
jgi:uncharacterized protein (TIGR00159 family)